MTAGLPHGWFVPVSPGTRQVTIGGAIAADVHGKNHHRAGSFAAHVRELSLLLPSGELRTVTPGGDPELFWATAGGMGLTGLVTRAIVQLTKVGSSLLGVDTVRTADIDETMRVLAEHDATHGYTVAWSDSMARTWAAAPAARLSPAGISPPSATCPPPPGTGRSTSTLARSSPCLTCFHVVCSTGARFGSPTRSGTGRRRRAARASSRRRSRSFHPLDAISNWNRVYGRAGFRQYQYVLPFGEEAAVRRSFEIVSAHPAPSFVTVLKRFGGADPGLLSFPRPGWTLALDFPARTPALLPLLDRLDRLVLEHGGRVYLAKDSHVARSAFEAMYPQVEEFRRIRAGIDPGRVFASDLSRRLSL